MKTYPFLFLAATLFLNSQGASAQSVAEANFSKNSHWGECYPPLTERDLEQIQTDQNSFTDKTTSTEASGDYFSIVQPIAFHVIYQSDGTGKTPYNQLVQNVAELNAAFSAQEAIQAKYGKSPNPAKIPGFNYGPTDSKIRFVLHSVDYTENDEWFKMCSLSNYQPIVKQALRISPSQYLNVYSCNVSTNLGLSWLPYAPYRQMGSSGAPAVLPESHWMLGILVDHALFSGSTIFNGRWSQGKILTHEVGHHYGLKHLYDGGCTGIESLRDGSGDTPFQVGNPSLSCKKAQGLNSCKNLPGKDDNPNYMGINYDSCRTHFTPGQVDFMRTTIARYKPNLLKQPTEDCVSAIDSTDSSPDLRPCVGSVLSTSPPGHSGSNRPWCHTSATNPSVWGWACCPAANGAPGWENNCRLGTPKF